jgi:hypothetical protein
MQEMEITLGRLLRIYWLFLWRATFGAVVIGGVAGFIIGLVMGLARIGHDQIHLAGTIVGMVVGAVWSVIVLRMMLEKQYRDFRIVLIPVAAQNP